MVPFQVIDILSKMNVHNLSLPILYLDYVLILQYYIWKLNISSIGHPKIDLTLVMASSILWFQSPCLTNLFHAEEPQANLKNNCTSDGCIFLKTFQLCNSHILISKKIDKCGRIAIQSRGAHGCRLGDKGNPCFVWKRLVENQWKNHRMFKGNAKCGVRGFKPKPIKLSNKWCIAAYHFKLQSHLPILNYPLWPNTFVGLVWFEISIFSPTVKLGWWNLKSRNRVQVVSDLTNLW